VRGCLRCSVDGSLARGDNETPLLESTPDLGFNTATGVIPWFLYMPFVKKAVVNPTDPDGEFGWGGTSVKR